MDKVMINGVDVSGCEWFSPSMNGLCMLHVETIFCSDKNCCYKQIQQLKAENKLLKQTIRDKNIVAVVEESEKYKKALSNIQEIIDFRFKTAYMTFGFKEYDNLINDIEKIVKEVLK